MHEVTIRMSDEAFDSISYLIKNDPFIDIIEDKRHISEDKFLLDVNELVKTAEQIKRGDVSNFRQITDINQHMKDIEKEIAKL